MQQFRLIELFNLRRAVFPVHLLKLVQPCLLHGPLLQQFLGNWCEPFLQNLKPLFLFLNLFRRHFTAGMAVQRIFTLFQMCLSPLLKLLQGVPNHFIPFLRCFRI